MIHENILYTMNLSGYSVAASGVGTDVALGGGVSSATHRVVEDCTACKSISSGGSLPVIYSMLKPAIIPSRTHAIQPPRKLERRRYDDRADLYMLPA